MDRHADPYRRASLAAGLDLAAGVTDPGPNARHEPWTHDAWRALCLVAWGGGDVEAAALDLAQRLKRPQSDARSSAQKARNLTDPPALPEDAFNRLREGGEAPRPRTSPADRKRREAEARRTRLEEAEARRDARCEPLPGAAELWGRCLPARSHAGCRSWLVARALRPTVGAADLVRVLPSDGPVPDWIDRRWSLVLPAWNVGGDLVALRGRWVRSDDAPNGAKERSPNGAGAARGFYANPAALAGLRGDAPPPAVVVVAEGGPDWIAWSNAAPAAVGVIGQWNGSDAADAAQRLAAAGSRLVLNAQDADDTGGRLAGLVRSVLRLEAARVLRLEAPQPADWTGAKPADWCDAVWGGGSAPLLDALAHAAEAEGIDL